MVTADEWRALLAAARLGDPRAADRAVELLIQWAERHLRGVTGADREDLPVDFAAHMIRDQFAHLAAVEPPHLDAYLGHAWHNWFANWCRERARRQAHEILEAELTKTDDEGEEDGGIDEYTGRVHSPEEIVLLRGLITELRAEVARLGPTKQKIFALLSMWSQVLAERRGWAQPSTAARTFDPPLSRRGHVRGGSRRAARHEGANAPVPRSRCPQPAQAAAAGMGGMRRTSYVQDGQPRSRAGWRH